MICGINSILVENLQFQSLINTRIYFFNKFDMKVYILTELFFRMSDMLV